MRQCMLKDFSFFEEKDSCFSGSVLIVQNSSKDLAWYFQERLVPEK